MNIFLHKFSPRGSTKRWTRQSKWLAFFVGTLLFSSVANAQISGTKTVCSSGCDYVSISKAVSDLKAKGVNGAITIQISSGNYNESFSIGGITGVSATNTITFKGMGSANTDVHVYNTNTYVIELSNISYITLQNMWVEQTTNSSYYYGIDLNTAKNCTVKDCKVTVNASSSNYDLVPMRVRYSSDNMFENNWFRGGYNCVGEGGWTTGCARNTYKNNLMTKFYQYAVVAYYSDKNLYIGNTIDSGSYQYAYGYYSYGETNATYKNNVWGPTNWYYNFFYVGSGTFEFSNNTLNTGTAYYGLYIYTLSSAATLNIWHNTIYSGTSSTYAPLYFQNQSKATVDFRNNNITRGSSGYTLLYYMATPNDRFEGNNYYNTGGNLLIWNGSGYSSLAAYKTAAKTFGNMGQTDQSVAVTYKSATDLHVDQSSIVPFGRALSSVKVDRDGDNRCIYFATSGSDESTYTGNPHYAKPSKPSFTGPSIAYDGNPTVFYNGAKSTGGLDPVMYHWYVNGKWVSDSFHLETVALTAPTSKIKLVAENCGGKDSVETTVSVTTPTAAPVSDFISDLNVIKQGQKVLFTDLSVNYPSTWKWEITPINTFANGQSNPSYTVTYGSLSLNTVQVQFNYSDKYKVCLTTSNKKGAGNTECKVDYITVIPATNMPTAGTVTITNGSGYLYDNGGPSKNPSGNYVQNKAIISGCADSVYLVFTMFDLACGMDYIRLFEGTDATGRSLNKCASPSYVGSNFGGVTGYTGGPSSATTGCAYAACTPKITDTFKAKQAMYIEMGVYGYTSTPGFEAYYWTKPRTEKKPVAKFTSMDSICTNGILTFTNQTVGNNVTYVWDLDGNMDDFEATGPKASWPYFTDGQVTVTLIASNCGGSDTFQKTITVFNPAAPSTAFVADNTNPTLNDVVFFSTDMKECVDNYKWTITSASGKGQAVFINGTKNTSANPQVSFTDTGCYSVELYTANSTGDDNLKLNCYIKVKSSYCVPSVMNQAGDIGISKVMFNTISNTTPQAQTGYNNYLTNLAQATTVEIGVTYKLTVERTSTNNKATRTAWIDWNADGDFNDAGEKVGEELNKATLSWSTDITIPSTAKTGATVLRVAINQGSQTNTPCGPNKFGEFEDYRLYIRPDLTKPVITLVGSDTVVIEQGQAYADSGATAMDNLDGDITSQIVTTTPTQGFNLVPGTYTYKYNVADAAQNDAATVTRVVIVKPDATAPELLVTKPDTIMLQVFAPFAPPAVISANDLVDGDLSGAVQIVNGVNANVIGEYTVTYTVSDVSKNKATVVRVVKVIDTLVPTMTLVGSSTVTQEVGATYTDSGVVVKDNYTSETDLRKNLVVQSNVDVNVVGTYTVVYVLTDPNTNKTVTVSRTVEVKDTQKPVLTLNGDSTITLDVFATLIDPGVKVSDNYDKNLQATAGGSFYQNFPNGKATKLGTYQVVYTVTDASGNTTTISRTINVVDRVAPTFTLTGDPAASVCRWGTYTDAGYTVSDNYDATGDLTISQEGSFLTEGTKLEGVYSLRYKAVDKSGNVGYSEYRYIFVRNPYEFPCSTATSVGEQIGLDKLVNVYPNPNQGKFTVEANIAQTEQVRITVTNLLGQEVAVISNGALNTHTFQVDLSNQKAGVYMLNVTTSKQSVTKRIVVTK